jgi:hypothetical protein
MTSDSGVNSRFRKAISASALSPSAMLVNPRTSANSTVTSRVSPPSFSLSWLRASSSTSGAET